MPGAHCYWRIRVFFLWVFFLLRWKLKDHFMSVWKKTSRVGKVLNPEDSWEKGDREETLWKAMPFEFRSTVVCHKAAGGHDFQRNIEKTQSIKEKILMIWDPKKRQKRKSYSLELKLSKAGRLSKVDLWTIAPRRGSWDCQYIILLRG